MVSPSPSGPSGTMSGHGFSGLDDLVRSSPSSLQAGIAWEDYSL